MQMQNAPHPLATTIPGMADPFQALAMERGAAMREEPTSSLAAFNARGAEIGHTAALPPSEMEEPARRGPGRPRKEEAA
jgi:hypothetical protein